MALLAYHRQLAPCVVQLHHNYGGENIEEINSIHTKPIKGELLDPGAESLQESYQVKLDHGAERINYILDHST